MPLLFGSIFSPNRIEILSVLPENESQQQKIAYSLANSIVFAQKEQIMKSCDFTTYKMAEGYRR
jgi:hypothetical protein